MDHWGIWDWTKFICCNRPLEIANDTNSLKQRSFYESDIGYTAQEIHEQHQRLHHLVQQQLQQQQLSSSHRRSQDDPGIDDEDTIIGNDSCLHDAQRRSVIGYNNNNNNNNSTVNLYEDTTTYRHSSTLLGLNPHNDYERLKVTGRNSDIDSVNPSRRNNLNNINNNNNNNNINNNCKNNNRNSDSNIRTSNKTLLDITNHQNYPHQLITMDGLRNQLVRRKSGTGSTSTTALRPPTVERCDQLQVTLRGWLYRLEGGAIKQWKRRWFVLGDYCLFYYKDSNEEKCHGSILLPSYRVSLCRSTEDGITRKYSFKLEHQNMKTYFLAADSKESMEQWMTALNLASIMQLNYGSSDSNGNSTGNINSLSRRNLSSVQQAATITGNLVGYGNPEACNHPDGSDVTDSRIMMIPGSVGNVGKGYPTRCLSGGMTGGGGEEEEDSGFNSYIPRRPPMPNSLNNSSTDSSGYLPAGAKYPGSYNCIGLPPMSYHGSSYLAGHSAANPQLSSSLIYPAPATHQKRSHYANAPPKPRRQQLDESGVLNCSDLYPVTNEFGAIPPGSIYNTSNTNQYFSPGNGPAPDLIAHNNANTNVSNNSPNSGGNVAPVSTSNDPNNSISSNNSNNNIISNQNGANNGVNTNTNTNYYQGSPFNPSDYPQPDGLNMQYQLTSPMSPTANLNQHYSIPPPSQFTVSTNQLSGYHHHHPIQQQIQSQQAQQQQQQQQQQSSANQFSRTRLPPRPHSADFLDREAQDEDEMTEIENCYQTGNVNGNSSSSKSNGAHQQYYQQQQQQQQSTTAPAHHNNATGQVDSAQQNANNGNNTNQQSIQTPKILPIRPKSSLERYDPYYYTNQIEYGTSNGPVNQQSQSQQQQLTSPPPRPWSDYLQQQAARQQTTVSQQQPLQATTSNGLPANASRPKGINFPPSNLDISPRGQQDRDVSLLRLLEWKQKMLSGPLNKRNNSSNNNTSNTNMATSTGGGSKGIISGSAKSPSHHQHHLQHSHHLNSSLGSDLTFSDVPMRPPLPKEYRNKMGLPDYPHNSGGGFMGVPGDMRSREEPIFSRERSKSIGSSFPVADITYSSDDEAIKSGSNDATLQESTTTTVNRVRRRHESCGNPLNTSSTSNENNTNQQSKESQLTSAMVVGTTELPVDRTCASPDYMNINQLYSIPAKMITSNPSYLGPIGSPSVVDCNLIETNHMMNPNYNIVTTATAVMANTTIDGDATTSMGSSSSVLQPGVTSLPRSVGDGQESQSNLDNFVKREDYYKAPSTLRQPDLTMSTHLPSHHHHPQSSSSSSSMMMAMMTTGVPIPVVANQSMSTGNVLIDPSLVSSCYTQQLSTNCQQFATYNTVTSIPMGIPVTSVIPNNIGVSNMGNVNNNNNNPMSGYSGYPEQWVDPVVDPNQMSRYLAHGTKLVPSTSSLHPCRPASCGPSGLNVSGTIVNQSNNPNTSISNKMAPPPPPPKPQSKNTTILPTKTHIPSTAPYVDTIEPRDYPTRVLEDKTSNTSKHGNIIVDAENNVVVNASNIIQNVVDNKGKHFVEPVKPEETIAPPANFVKERIALLESKVNNNESDPLNVAQQSSCSSALSSLSSSTSLKVEGKQQNVNLRNQSKIFREIYSEPDVALGYQESADKLATISQSTSSSATTFSVLADLRKTAESNRGERQLTSLESSASGNHKEGETTPLSDRGEADGSSGSNQPVCSKSSILANNHKQTVGGGSSSIDQSSVPFTGYDDKGEDADDELSREFDSSQYNANNIPISAKQQQKQILSTMVTTGSVNVSRRGGHNLQNLTDCVPTSSLSQLTKGDPLSSSSSTVTFKSVPELVMDSSSSYSTSMDNPAYVSSSYLEFAIKETDEKQQQDENDTNSGSCDEKTEPQEQKCLDTNEVKSGSLEDIANLPEAPKIAPYYYSDLLPNNSDGLELPINYREREKLSSRLQRVNNHNYGAARKGGGVIGEDEQSISIGASGKKRCVTPEVIMEANEKPPSFVRDNQLRSSLRYTDSLRSEKRKSKSLENLDDDHLYENLEFIRSTNPHESTKIDGEMMINHPNSDEILPKLPVKQKNILMTDNVNNSRKSNVTYSQIRKVVKFDDTLDHRDEHDQIGEEKMKKEPTSTTTTTTTPPSSSSVMMETESESERSLIEGEGSQSGSYLDKKLKKRRSPRNRRSQDDLKNVSDSETTSKPPPPPPLPLGYNQHGYPYYCVTENNNHSSKLQRKLSRSVGTGLQNEQDIYNSKIFSSAGELLGKTHEELVLLLIQLRRNQSHLASTCDSLRLQMESEEKMMEIEPQRREEHKSRYKELRESLLEAERQYESQFPVIDMVDNMVKLNHPGPGTSVSRNRQQQQQQYSKSHLPQSQNNQFNRDYHYNQQLDSSPTDNDNDSDFKRGKAVSTSFLDRFPESQGAAGVSASSSTTVAQPSVSHPPPMVPQRGEQLKFTNYLSPPKKKETTEDEVESEDQVTEQEKLIHYLKQDKDILEKTLEGVRSSLTDLSLNDGSDGDDPRSASSNVDKMKQQQQMLEGELGRVRGLIVQSAKRLEQRSIEDPWNDSDVILARSQLEQMLSATSTPTTATATNSSSSSSSKSSNRPGPVSLEAELANIDSAIDSLHAKRKEILENFKKTKSDSTTATTASTTTSPTSGHPQQQQSISVLNNNQSAGKTNTSTSSGYGETDMDSMESRDMTPFNYLKGYQQISPEEELATASSSGSNNVYENLDSNLVNYSYKNNTSRSVSSNKINGGRSIDEYLDDNQGRSDDSTSETISTTTSTTATTTSTITSRGDRGFVQESNASQMMSCYNNDNNYGDYGESSDGQQYTFQQPLLASNKTVRLVKRESERRRVTNKLTTYTATSSTINYNNNNLNNTQYFQHFPQENDLSDFPVYTVNHSDGSTTIESIGGGNCDNQFTYDTVTGKRPSTLNLIESSSSSTTVASTTPSSSMKTTTIKSDERKEIDSSPQSMRSSLSNSANDLPALVMVGSSSCTFSGKDDLDLDKINNGDLIIRPTTSTSGYLSN
ncbi:uncharacterized protein LOC128388848 isoform X2 [Panonychus citri]|nr:uncharacterized protein LOC128388848 isoform X2 [Panonychus citri]